MADLIDRQAAISTALEKLTERERNCLINIWSTVEVKYWVTALLECLPSADAVEVVRCKDCYHYDEESEKCILNNSEMKPTDYCSYGSK